MYTINNHSKGCAGKFVNRQTTRKYTLEMKDENIEIVHKLFLPNGGCENGRVDYEKIYMEKKENSCDQLPSRPKVYPQFNDPYIMHPYNRNQFQ